MTEQKREEGIPKLLGGKESKALHQCPVKIIQVKNQDINGTFNSNNNFVFISRNPYK